MLDLGWSKLVFLIILALVVVGPRDLPRLARGAGEIISKLQRLVRQTQFSLKRLENEIAGAEQRSAEEADLLPDYVRQRMNTVQSEPAAGADPGPDCSQKVSESPAK